MAGGRRYTVPILSKSRMKEWQEGEGPDMAYSVTEMHAAVPMG